MRHSANSIGRRRGGGKGRRCLTSALFWPSAKLSHWRKGMPPTIWDLILAGGLLLFRVGLPVEDDRIVRIDGGGRFWRRRLGCGGISRSVLKRKQQRYL